MRTHAPVRTHPKGIAVATVGELYQLQEIDNSSQSTKRRLLEIQALLTETAEVAQARQAMEASLASLQSWQAQQKDAELESQSLKGKIEENDRRLMSGTIRQPKELEAMQANGDSMRRHRAVVDERAMEALLHVEESTTQAKKDEATFNQVRSQWAGEQRTLITEGKGLQKAYAQLKAQRAAQAARLDRPSLVEYETLRKRKGGVAVARINDDTCGACFVRLPTGIIGSARSSVHTAGAPRTLCASCGRILYAG